MIKLENTIVPSPEQMQFTIEGMRNPMNSWKKSDTDYFDDSYILGANDYNLMNMLSKCGPVHSKYKRMLNVYVRITAPLYWWKEFDTYKLGTVSNSCSTMHKIQAKEFTHRDFSEENLTRSTLNVLDDVIWDLNQNRKAFLETNDRKYWWSMIQLLPTSYNQTRNIMLNYEVLTNIYATRRNHKLTEWHDFLNWIETLPYCGLITGETDGQE